MSLEPQIILRCERPRRERQHAKFDSHVERAVFFSGRDWFLLSSGNGLGKRDRNVAPDLDGKDDRGGEKKRADGDVNHGCDYHRQLGLGGILSPHDARDERQEPEAELRDHEREHEDGGAFDGFDLAVNRDGANRSPGEDDGDDTGMDDVRPPTQPVVAKHGAEE